MVTVNLSRRLFGEDNDIQTPFETMTVKEMCDFLQAKYPHDTPVFATWEGLLRGIDPKRIEISNYHEVPVLYIDVE